MKAILLVRVSTEQQQLDEQTKQLVNYAIQKGYSKDNLIIIEDKESALKLDEDERRGLNQMKAEIADNADINAVFVWELSRLFRKQKTGYSLREYFITNQIQLYCYSPNFQLLAQDLKDVDSAGSIAFALFAEMADAEMRNKKARFHRSKIRNAKTAKYSGGFVKYGYYIDEKGYYQINEEESELIQYIFNEYENGKSTYKIRRELKERGLAETQFFVRGVLISECYTGISNQYGMNRVYPQIISAEQFQNCRRIAKENNKKADKTFEIYYCKKLIKCTECGTHYIAMKSSTMYLCYGRYGKEARLYPEKACKNSTQLNINILDSLVWDLVQDIEIFHRDEDLKKGIEYIKTQIDVNNQKISNSNNQILGIENKKDRNNDMYLSGNILKEKYISNSKKIDEEAKSYLNLIATCKNEISRLESRLNEFGKQLSIVDYANNRLEYLESLQDDSIKYEIIKKHIKEINIYTDKKDATKIVVIHFYENQPQRFRIHIKKKPALIEFDMNYDYYGILPEKWMEYPLEVVKRFERIKSK